MVTTRDGNETNSKPQPSTEMAPAKEEVSRKRKAQDDKAGEQDEATGKALTKAKKLKQPLKDGKIESLFNDPKECPFESGAAPRTITPAPGDETHPSTPGRRGPVKDECLCNPDIKPFKGEPGHKVRKSAGEKHKEYTDFVKEHEGHSFHELHVCFEKGPKGSPTYDKAGFELDYDKVAKWMKPTSISSLRRAGRNTAHWDKVRQENDKENMIFFGQAERYDTPHYAQDVARDQISKDLGIPFHKVGLKEFEQWNSKGFKGWKLDDLKKLSEDDKERLSRMTSGAALRK